VNNPWSLYCFVISLYYFISPYLENGDLRNALDQDENMLRGNKEPKINQDMRLKIIYQVARAVDFLHTPVHEFR